MSRSRLSRAGFTFVELLVIVAIIAIIVALMLPSVRRVRVASAQVHCQNNLKQLGLALHSYVDSKGSFPPGCIGPEATPEERLSWMVEILPYVEQGNLQKQFDLEKGYETNLPIAQSSVRTFLCPTLQGKKQRLSVSHYVGVAGIGSKAATRPKDAPGNGIMGYARKTTFPMITDGLSSTIALIETGAKVGPWARGGTSTVRGYEPDIPLTGERKPFGGHDAGMNVVMADGSVRLIRYSIDPKQLAAAVTLADGDRGDLD